jgi:trimethylamine--corrinoid protein Co-methyltransferase
VADCLAMFRLARRLSAKEFAAALYCFTVINTNSPLQIDIRWRRHHRLAEAGQLNIVTPVHAGRSDGADHDRRRAGAAACEALAGIALTQIVRPGRRWFMADSPPTST